jgi:hypothetical protein
VVLQIFTNAGQLYLGFNTDTVEMFPSPDPGYLQQLG